jgi:hypothetical protein
MNKLDKEIWVFLSHSNKDYDKVKEVRNMLENMSFRPIMFYLLCLSDDDEVDNLIKREIDARTRFIYCDSENARESKWVQTELEYIRLKERRFQTIDLSLPNNQILQMLKEFKDQIKVFISYPRKYRDLARILYHRLNLYDLFVFFDYSSIIEGNFQLHTNEAINNVARGEGGMFLFIYDEIVSDYQLSELKNAINNGCKIYAFNIGEDINPILDEMLSQTNAFKFNISANPMNEIMEVILDKAFDHGSIMSYLNQFRTGEVVNDLEADLCWKVFENKAWNSEAPYARVALAREYKEGRLVKRNLEKAYYCLQYAVKGEHLKQYEHELHELQKLIKQEKIENNK